VRVDAEPHPATVSRGGQRPRCRARPLRDDVGERSTVRVAQDHRARARGDRGLQRRQGIRRVGAPAVEVVLRVVDDLATRRERERDRVGDHREVLVEAGPECLAHVQRPRLAEQGDDGRGGRQQRGEVGVALRRDPLPPRRPEGRQPRAGERHVPHAGEEVDVLRVGARPASLDDVHAEGVESQGDRDLVVAGEADALALGAVAERGVVDLHPLAGHAPRGRDHGVATGFRSRPTPAASLLSTST